MKARFGTLYLGLRAKKDLVIGYSVAFLVRRSAFIAITFALFDQPGIQLLSTIILTLLQISYTGYSDLHDTLISKRLELANEFIFITISYNFVLLSGLVSDFETRDMIGEVIISLTAFLLSLNLLIILTSAIKTTVRRCQLRLIKSKKLKQHEKSKQRKLQQLLQHPPSERDFNFSQLTSPIAPTERNKMN